jgi:hypothetical protein
MDRIGKFLVAILAMGAAVAAQATEPGSRGASVALKLDTGHLPLYSESHALVIGASDYTNGWPSLKGVKADVEQVRQALARQGFDTHVVMNPTRIQLEEALRDFESDYGEIQEARLLIYFAGHGYTLTTPNARQLGYIVPVDAPRPAVGNNGPFKKGALSMTDIENVALQIISKHVLFVFDSCFAGSIFAATRGIPDDISVKTTRVVRQFITAGSADQTVPDVSIFRAQFVEGIGGEADLNRDGYVTGSELGGFLEATVTNYSQGSQTPEYGKLSKPGLDKGDFVFEVPKRSMLERLPVAGSSLQQKSIEARFWDSVEKMNTFAGYDEYLKKYPNGDYESLARLKRAGIGAATQAPVISTETKQNAPAPVPTPKQPAAPFPALNTKANADTAGEYWIDPEMGLMWTARDNGSDIDWDHADSYCRGMTLAGMTDWQLPSIDVLKKRFDPSIANGYRIASPLQLSGSWVWSGTKYSSAASWYFDFSDGHAQYDAASPCKNPRSASSGCDLNWMRVHSGSRALCVRAFARTWTDPATHLTWTVEPWAAKLGEDDRHDWNHSNEHCRELTLDGVTGWRLPSIDELQAMFDPSSVEEYMIKSPLHLDFDSFQVWSGTKSGWSDAWAFPFAKGIANERSYYRRNQQLSTLCVRDSGK